MPMYPPPKVSRRESQLLRQLGTGRVAHGDRTRLLLGYTRQQRHELVLSCTVDGQPLQLGVDESQWLTWVSRQLPIGAWSMLAEDLRLPTAAVTLTALHELLQSLGVSAPKVASVALDATPQPHHGWFLRLEEEAQPLSLQVLEAPLDWLAALVHAMRPQAIDDGPPVRAPIGLIAGWSTVERSALRRMKPGDALSLRKRFNAGAGQWVLFRRRPLAVVTIALPNTGYVESVMHDFNDWLDVKPAPTSPFESDTADLLVSVVAEVATLEVPLHCLTTLAVGDLLEGPIHSHDLITLKIGDHPIAYGTLLDIDGQLAVRIERLVANA